MCPLGVRKSRIRPRRRSLNSTTCSAYATGSRIASFNSIRCLCRRCQSLLRQENGASWYVEIYDDRICYLGCHSDREKHFGRTIEYSTNNWPFVLFEVVHSALGVRFDRTNIDLCFFVIRDRGKFADERSSYKVYPSVPHKDLKLIQERLKDPGMW